METLLNNWDSILEGIKEDNNLSDISFKTWLKPLEVYSIEDDTLYILYNENTDKRM